MTRLRIAKQTRVDGPETDFILHLAKAGMSYRCIAQEVYGSTSDYHVSRIGYILSYEEVKVTDYRNGKSPTGRAMIAAIRRDANVLSAIRQAASRVTGALKAQKTG